MRGGIDVPAYLGSASTFTLGGFGGHGGRVLLTGDVLHIGNAIGRAAASERSPRRADAARSRITWEIGVLYGPHGAPDFFHREDIDTFFATRLGGALQLRPAPASG